MRLLLIFVFVPLLELFLLLRLADLITGWWTFVLVVVTGVVGASLARRQGWQVVRRLQSELEQGVPPTTSVVDALMIFVAGALLITPGVLTDILGFSLLVPQCRRVYRGWVMGWLRRNFRVESYVNVTGFGGDRTSSAPGDQIIDSYVLPDSPADAERDSTTETHG